MFFLICVGPMACSSESSESSDKPPADVASASANAESVISETNEGNSDVLAVSRLTPDYLEGKWCYSRFVGGTTKDEPHSVNYVIRKDGTLTREVNDTTENTKEGEWYINGYKFAISPYTKLPMNVLSVSHDEFVLTGLGDRYFTRGRCK